MAEPTKTAASPNPAANAWMDYVERACGSLYPSLRQGIDYVWGRRPLPTPANPDDPPAELADPEMLHWSDKLQPVDMAAIQAKAQEYADTDPNARQEPLDGGIIDPPPESRSAKKKREAAEEEAAASSRY